MKRTVLPVVILMAISIITLGTIIGASSEAKDPTTVLTDNPVDQATGVSETTQFAASAAPVVKTIQLTPVGSKGNYRHPGVAEDSQGNRLVIFRGANGKEYDYVYCPKDGKWSAPKSIANGNQPALEKSLYANIEIDSTDRFHCQWENAKGAVYASFKNGVWTTPFKIKSRGRYDLTSGMAVSSTDEVVTVDCEVLNKSKDIYIHRKGKDSSTFSAPFNLSRDKKAASTQPCIALDSRDHAFVVWKSDFLHSGLEENLVIYLSEFDTNNADVGDWYMMSPDPGWSFLAQVAVNSEDKVMTMYASSKVNQYMSRSYDPATKKLGDMVSFGIGLCRQPWHTFFSRLNSHGKDFYAAVLDPGRILWLMKFDEAASEWNKVAQISNVAAEMFDLYSGYDQMLIAWNTMKEPTSVFLTTVDVDPFSKIKVKSVSNLKTESLVKERSFFQVKFLNILTWEANPENTKKGVTVLYHRIYRKTRSEDNSKWVRVTEVAGTVFRYEDRYVPGNSDYVYAVTCVDDREHESEIFN